MQKLIASLRPHLKKNWLQELSSDTSSSSSRTMLAGMKADMQEVWPELEKAERLARGAALKWASGIFYHPDQLEQLSHYRKRESQRTSSIQSRLKSAVQSYLEGVGAGLAQLHLAMDDIQEMTCKMKEIHKECRDNTTGFQSLECIRDCSSEYKQLSVAIQNLPRLYSVPAMVMETKQLIDSKHLLEAHARLMELETWRDDIYWQLQQRGPPSPETEEMFLRYFAGVQTLEKTLAKTLWEVIDCGLALVREDPTLFVSAVRIIEREESIDQALLENSEANSYFLPPGRPKNWRSMFFNTIEKSVNQRLRETYISIRGQGLAKHLASLQTIIMNDLATVQHLLEQCCPPHYHLTHTYLHIIHKCLSAHLQQVINWDLESSEIFTLLNWSLHVYYSPEMIQNPDLCSEVDIDDLAPLISNDALEQLQTKYINTVRYSVSEWMQKALEVEVMDWQGDQEPETDHEGFYQTSIATIVIQMLEENIRVALVISESLRDQMIAMGLCELETFVSRFRSALVEYVEQHQKDRKCPKNFLQFLLAAINSFVSLRSAVDSLHQQQNPRVQCQSSYPPFLKGTLEEATRKVCQLVTDELLQEIQPYCLHLLCRSWLFNCDFIDSICRTIDQHFTFYQHVREPYFQVLVTEVQWSLVVEYVRAFMQKRMVCRSAEERSQLSDRMSHDALQIKELFHRRGIGRESGWCQCLQGPKTCERLTGVLNSLAEIIRLKDNTVMSLKLDRLFCKYPDISEEQVLMLLEIRGDVPKDVRSSVLQALEQSAHPFPQGYRPIFKDIDVPPSSMPFCIPTIKCA
ncbi:exocyst complex component 3-like protein isoform X2 [Erpetoichthys calabaricus]|uniref:exocyst complex component 3-like protein isoform X2 n=1 Tax=Erpetoichthys calabaricus TaxID=27687 RepID=UPI00109FE225|nr:exocyst complex component 3-like protein isoform X2 [Erpetoichthys calabaricus]